MIISLVIIIQILPLIQTSCYISRCPYCRKADGWSLQELSNQAAGGGVLPNILEVIVVDTSKKVPLTSPVSPHRYNYPSWRSYGGKFQWMGPNLAMFPMLPKPKLVAVDATKEEVLREVVVMRLELREL